MNFSEIVGRIKQAKGLKDDHEVASLLGFTKTAFSERKRRNSIPRDRIELFCERESINMNWILTGDGPDMILKTPDGSRIALEVIPSCHGGEVEGHMEPADLDVNAPLPDELEIMFDKLDSIYDRISGEDRDRLYVTVSRLYDKYEKAAIDRGSGRTGEAGDTSQGRFPEGAKEAKKQKRKSA